MRFCKNNPMMLTSDIYAEFKGLTIVELTERLPLLRSRVHLVT